jgi:hypothetical protein
MSEPAAPGPDLRRMVLGLDPAEAGLAPSRELPHVWGAVMDIGVEGGWASVVALADGTTSLYTSGGGGVIGAGAHERVASASARLLRLIEGELGRFEPTEDLDPPGADQTRFLALTYDGPRAAGGRSETLRVGSDPLSAIFLAGHELVGELRLLSER